MRVKVAVLVSGGGTNLQALLDANLQHGEIAFVLSNRKAAYALERARARGVRGGRFGGGGEPYGVRECGGNRMASVARGKPAFAGNGAPAAADPSSPGRAKQRFRAIPGNAGEAAFARRKIPPRPGGFWRVFYC